MKYYCILRFDSGLGNDLDEGFFSSRLSARKWASNRGTMGQPYTASLYRQTAEGSMECISTWKPRVSNKPNECGNPSAWQTLTVNC